jgi:hypothetical protein
MANLHARPVRRYIQWLDGAYTMLALDLFRYRQVEYDKYFYEAESILKLYALFGMKIILSDVQVIDSPVLLRLFSSSDFRKNYLTTDKGKAFFGMSARIEEEKSLTFGQRRIRIANSGLVRASRVHWISSPPEWTELINRFATRFKDEEIDLNREVEDNNSDFSKLRSQFVGYEWVLQGLLYSVDHFEHTEMVSVLPSRQVQPKTMYEILLGDMEDTNIPDEAKIPIGETIRFIDKYVDRERRQYKAEVWIKAREIYKEDPEMCRLIMQNSHIGWDQSVQRTILADGVSLKRLPFAMNPELFQERVTDLFLPKLRSGDKYVIPGLKIKTPLLNLDWDFGKMTWKDVAEASRATAETAEEYQRALNAYKVDDESSVEAVFYATWNHVNALSRELARLQCSKLDKNLSPYFWVLARGVIIAIGLLTQAELGNLVKYFAIAPDIFLNIRNDYLQYKYANTLNEVAISFSTDAMRSSLDEETQNKITTE